VTLEQADAQHEIGNMLGLVTLEQVETFWSQHPCGATDSNSTDRRAYFEDIERRRYSRFRHIPEVARFEAFTGRRVLEIGCGVGTDGRQFARHGALYTGINLDEGSSRLAREAFAVFELPGAILKMNAEELTFPDESFDHVYSLGVIHHSPNPERIVAEMLRVLKPGGTVATMVYNKSSVNYYVEIQFLRRLLRYALLPAGAPRLIARLTGFSHAKLRRHREILFSERMTPERWISINTDGPDCPLARVYTGSEIVATFAGAGFSNVRTYVRFFDTEHYSFVGALIPNWLADAIGNRWGWSRWVEAVRPLDPPSTRVAGCEPSGGR
jgi:2-polyprenyl-3-methyl-5-hydroxy-6-metoxy-1,4-benzoquinol methylase